MNKLLSVGSVASVLLVSSVVSAEVVHQSSQVKGESASASWYSGDECSYSSAYIFGGEQVSHTAGGQPQYAAYANAYVNSFNWCTGESFEGYGQVEGGGVSVSGLTSATLEVPVSFYRWDCSDSTGEWLCEQIVTGTGTFTATVAGTGETVQGRNSSNWRSGTFRVSDRYNGKYRQGTVTGSLIVDGQQLLVGQSYGEISNVNAGNHTVTRF